jgi:hypothetical protein
LVRIAGGLPWIFCLYLPGRPSRLLVKLISLGERETKQSYLFNIFIISHHLLLTPTEGSGVSRRPRSSLPSADPEGDGLSHGAYSSSVQFYYISIMRNHGEGREITLPTIADSLIAFRGLKKVAQITVCSGDIRFNGEGVLACNRCEEIYEDVRREMTMCGRVIGEPD